MWAQKKEADSQQSMNGPYHFVFDFGQVDLHVHGVWRGVHHLLLLFLQAFSHCLDGFSPFFPEGGTGSRKITSAQSHNCFLINRKAISSVSSANSQWICSASA